MTRAVDLFAGPGGWDVAARDLGIETVGIEWDAAACATRRAAGLVTIEGDVSHYGPASFPEYEGLIASPPCQTFSMAGGGAGRRALDDVLIGVKELALRQPLTVVHDDIRTGLGLEPLRWALEAIDLGQAYRWLAFEQVPDVLPVWAAMDEVLEAEGYSVFHGKLYAEQFGVPQTRTRAVLVARLDTSVQWPTPTHSRYHARTPSRLDEGVPPWVSMAEALGWDDSTDREGGLWKWRDTPATTIAGDPRITAREHHYHGEQNGTSFRLTLEEAAALQTFPDDYPWQGNKGQKFQQVGNAVPPLLAKAILTEVTR